MAALCKGHLNSNCSQTVVLLLMKMNKKFKNGSVKALSSNQTYFIAFLANAAILIILLLNALYFKRCVENMPIEK